MPSAGYDLRSLLELFDSHCGGYFSHPEIKARNAAAHLAMVHGLTYLFIKFGIISYDDTAFAHLKMLMNIKRENSDVAYSTGIFIIFFREDRLSVIFNQIN